VGSEGGREDKDSTENQQYCLGSDSWFWSEHEWLRHVVNCGQK